MANSKKGVLIYLDTLSAIQLLPDAQAGILFKQILQYGATGQETHLEDQATAMCWAFVKQQLDRDAQKYEAICEKRRAAGSKGGQQRIANQANATTCNQVQANQANTNRDTNIDRNRDTNINTFNDGVYLADIPCKPDIGRDITAMEAGAIF